MNSPRLSHFDIAGTVSMVDIGDKATTTRIAEAAAEIIMKPATLALLQAGELTKGDAIATARIAGIMAAKQTSTLIPLCHPVALSHCSVDFEFDNEASLIRLRATARTEARTGVEMEALTAVAVAALTLYDMAKAADRSMIIGAIHLVRKQGGRSGSWSRDSAVR